MARIRVKPWLAIAGLHPDPRGALPVFPLGSHLFKYQLLGDLSIQSQFEDRPGLCRQSVSQVNLHDVVTITKIHCTVFTVVLMQFFYNCVWSGFCHLR
jgi:hypothetical protein